MSGENTPRCQSGHMGLEAARAIRLLALTGMRRDEVLDLTWPQVDWRQGMLRLPRRRGLRRSPCMTPTPGAGRSADTGATRRGNAGPGRPPANRPRPSARAREP